jgi:hypothetical protein
MAAPPAPLPERETPNPASPFAGHSAPALPLLSWGVFLPEIFRIPHSPARLTRIAGAEGANISSA